MVTVFAGPNDANAIGQVIEAQLAGDDPRGFIDQQVRLWADDYAAVLRQIRQQAPGARIVVLNLPNLAAMPYFAARSTFQKSIMQRIAVSMSDHVNALRGRQRLRRRHHVRPARARVVQLLGRRLPSRAIAATR